MKKILLYSLLGILVIFVLIQLIPFGRQKDNPPVNQEPQWDSQQTRDLAQAACFDCHSNETVWPWYSNIAPISWVIADHVEEGREHFNVSAWGVQKHNEGEDAAEEVEEGEMPVFGYTFTHPEARFTQEEKARLIKGLKATFGEEDDHGDDD